MDKKQENLITLLTASRNITEACTKAKISRTTYYNWLSDEKFKTKLKAETGRVFFEARQKLKIATEKASDVLIELLEDKDIVTRRLCALSILDLAFKDKSEEIEERLEKVEKLILERRTYR